MKSLDKIHTMNWTSMMVRMDFWKNSHGLTWTFRKIRLLNQSSVLQISQTGGRINLEFYTSWIDKLLNTSLHSTYCWTKTNLPTKWNIHLSSIIFANSWFLSILSLPAFENTTHNLVQYHLKLVTVIFCTHSIQLGWEMLHSLATRV